MVIEQDHLRRCVGQRHEFVVGRRDVDVGDLRAVERVQVDDVVVAACAVVGIVTPGAAHRPGGAVAVGTTGVEEADASHGAEGNGSPRGPDALLRSSRAQSAARLRPE